jgi:hypothetical protein
MGLAVDWVALTIGLTPKFRGINTPIKMYVEPLRG